MPGMNTGLGTDNPTIASAFKSALLHQGMVVLLIVVLAAGAWQALRIVQWRRAEASGGGLWPSPSLPVTLGLQAEPVARRLLRVAFGLLWIFDGILQAQSSMPLGLVPNVIQPTAAASPGWAQHLLNWGATTWSYHPVSAAAAAVWIQVGIGVWMLVSPRGSWSRLSGAASAGWGLVVFVFGESFGGLFAPGVSWLFGAPGASLFYVAAGALVAVPEQYWRTPRLGRGILRVMGLFFLGMAVLEAWPGRGFWQGQSSSGTGSVTSMVQEMAQTPQPHFLSSWLDTFASFDGAHGWAVNLFVVVALAVIGAAFLTASPRIVRVALVGGAVLCLATWVLVQDLGFLGGTGTDPNSMVPMLLVLVAGYLAVTKPAAALAKAAPAAAPSPTPSPTPALVANPTTDRPTARGRLSEWWASLTCNPLYALRWIAGLGALSIVLVGVVPMTVASADRSADPVIIEAIDGTPSVVNQPAPPFRLVDQAGRPVSLASLHGKVIALTFLDDVCTSVCPIIAQEFRAADELLSPTDRRNVELVAINANPRFVAPEFLAAFDKQEGLQHLRNWLFLSGPLRTLEQVWRTYGVAVEYLPGGAMIGHSLYASVIASGRIRWLDSADPGPGTDATQSSFSTLLTNAITRVLGNR